ncbi:chloride channel protein [Synechococcus sp. BSF8S]|uniref:chloride channel protein n=1 Tax=Synechococcales TaxID=1890424 RepID=UPI0016241BE0|nr:MULTISPECIES: chloride channel protein [unclassified Synechococcus]MBC1260811.1 chloride channel protein [Synechococcus sp. BSF8S]MBC1263487.1 chloride channel protein [Synechococcus sp. BSA11S]
MQRSGLKPEAGFGAPLEGDTRGLPFQWSLLAWAALVGILTGMAVVGFHYLLGFINNFMFGTLVEWVLDLVSPHELDPTTVEVFSAPDPDSGTPLKVLVQIGLGGIVFLPPPPAPLPEPTSLPPIGPTGWLASWPVVMAPLLGGVAVGLLRQLGRDLGPGLPSLMAMADGAVKALPRLPVLRLVAASLSLGSGASLGPEGPSVESGGNLGLWVGLRGGLPPESQKALVAAGVAAGLAAGFKAPIAGVFFAFEGAYSAIPGRPSLRAVLVAAVASSLVTQLCLGDEPIFRLPAYEVRSPLELPLYLGLGLVASLMSWALVSLLAAGRSGPVQRQCARLPLWLLNGLGGLAVGVLALGFPQVLGVGYDTIEALLGSEGGVALTTLAALLAVKLLATAVSNATGFVGGGFAPALVLGAVLGNGYGQLLGDSGLGLPVAEPPAYAMVGMAAVLAGSARAPLTALLLLFELTHDIRIVLPLMAAAGLSAVLVERWHGLADPGLLGPDPAEERRRQGLASLMVNEALEGEAPLVLAATTPASEALGLLIEAHGHCLVVEREGWVIGVVTLVDLQRAISASHGSDGLPLPLEQCRRSDLLWLHEGANLAQLEDQLVPNGLRQVPVFALESPSSDLLPAGLPNTGLPVRSLVGLASRDGMARALARQLQV